MKKKMIFALSLCLLIISSLLAGKWEIKTPTAYGKASYRVSDLKELVKDSEFIVIGTVGKGINITKFKEVDFTESVLEVEEIIKANTTLNSTINILQTKDLDIDPKLVKGDKVLLFLDKYSGPITKEAYVIKGLYQGNYSIVNGVLRASKKDENGLPKKIDGKRLEDIIKDIKGESR